jgi:hypothetical protein
MKPREGWIRRTRRKGLGSSAETLGTYAAVRSAVCSAVTGQ